MAYSLYSYLLISPWASNSLDTIEEVISILGKLGLENTFSFLIALKKSSPASLSSSAKINSSTFASFYKEYFFAIEDLSSLKFSFIYNFSIWYWNIADPFLL